MSNEGIDDKLFTLNGLTPEGVSHSMGPLLLTLKITSTALSRSDEEEEASIARRTDSGWAIWPLKDIDVARRVLSG